MRFFTVAKFGPNRHLTPEGFLVCEDSVLARTGEQVYFKRENPEFEDEMFPDRFIVDRAPEDVFSVETLASTQGKPVVNDHPDANGWVNPGNYKELAIGHIINPHRGEGDQQDLMIADLMITDKDAIVEILHGKNELSLGYDADYVPDGDGRFRQKNFKVNHVALVDKGRCGPRCCIGDSAACDCKECRMKTKNSSPRSLIARLIKAVKTGDSEGQEEAEEALLEATDSADPEDVHVHLHDEGQPPPPAAASAAEEEESPSWFQKFSTDFKTFQDSMEGRMSALEAGAGAKTGDDDDDEEIEGQLEVEAPKGVTGDRARKATDSAYLRDAYQEAASLAEAIAPGITIPDFNTKAKPKATFDSLQSLRRKSLELGFVNSATRGLIEQIVGDHQVDFGKMTHDSLRTTFRAVGGLAKKQNNTRNARVGDESRGGMMPASYTSLADINAANRKRSEKSRPTAH